METRSTPQAFLTSYAPRLRAYNNSLLTPVIHSNAPAAPLSRTTKRGTTIVNYAEDGYDYDYEWGTEDFDMEEYTAISVWDELSELFTRQTQDLGTYDMTDYFTPRAELSAFQTSLRKTWPM